MVERWRGGEMANTAAGVQRRGRRSVVVGVVSRRLGVAYELSNRRGMSLTLRDSFGRE
jgi:hypothetical protein